MIIDLGSVKTEENNAIIPLCYTTVDLETKSSIYFQRRKMNKVGDQRNALLPHDSYLKRKSTNFL